MRQVLLLSLFFCLTALSAQPVTTVDDVKLQTRFIAAKQTALIGKTEAAVAQFTQLTEDAPEMDAAYFELGRLKFATEDTDAAIDHLVQAYQLRPSPVYAGFLAELYESSGRYKEGAALYAGLIKRQPAEVDYYLQRAMFLTRAQDIKGAIGVYNDLEDRIGVNAELARKKHGLYLGSGDTKRAEKELLALVESAPANLQYRHLLAGYYTSQNDKSAARKAYQEILRRQPDDVRAQLALQDAAPVKLAGDNAKLLATMADPTVSLDLKIGRLLPIVNELARSQDATMGEQASRLAAELRRVHPDEAKAAALQGDVYFHTNQLTKAADAYRATIALDDTVYPVWEQLLGTLYLTNQVTDLRKYAENALDVYPNRPAVYVHYALAEAFRADYDAATSLLQEAQLMSAGQAEATAALQALTTALSALENGNPAARIDLAKLPGGKEAPLAFLLAKGDNRTALVAYDTPENTNALFLELLGDAHAKAGDKAAAGKAYARAKAAGSKAAGLRDKMSKVQ